jgi:hypothetical protein
VTSQKREGINYTAVGVRNLAKDKIKKRKNPRLAPKNHFSLNHESVRRLAVFETLKSVSELNT